MQVEARRLGLPDPVGEETAKIVGLMYQKESDRGCVLVGVSYLDACLKSLLRARFGSAPKKDVDFLLSSSLAPLGSFSVRIKMSRVLNLLHTKTCDALESLREVRNECAHDFLHFEWPTALIDKACCDTEAVTEAMYSLRACLQIA
jgi:hypothetical protein